MKHTIAILLIASTVSGFSASRPSLLYRAEAYSSALGVIPFSEPSSSSLNAAAGAEEAPLTTDEECATLNKKSYLDDGFIFGLDGSGLERPKGKVAQVVVEGDSLETTNWQVALVTGTFLGHAGFAASAFNGMLEVNNGDLMQTSIQALTLLMSSWILADFGSGVLHWSVDNYGNGRTPIMGGIIAGFQGHHSAPWTITERGFCNNVYKLCVPFGLATMGLINFSTGPFITFFFTVFCVMEILSQEFHKWTHMTKGECPDWVNWLQKTGLTVDRKRHAQHHFVPYDGNYCLISGICNEWLDNSGFFRRLEHVVYELNGVESNAWKLDPELKQSTLLGEYSLQK
jgi:hypothetical protein